MNQVDYSPLYLIIGFFVLAVVLIVVAFILLNKFQKKPASKPDVFAENNCTPTFKLYNFALDEKNRRWAVDEYNYLFHLDDIIKFEIVDDKINSAQSIGLYVLITTKVQGYFAVRVNFHSGKTNLSSPLYQLSKHNAESFAAKLTQLTHKDEEASPAQNLSVADELAKYKQLLDSGAITQEEYDAKKKELLNL